MLPLHRPKGQRRKIHQTRVKRLSYYYQQEMIFSVYLRFKTVCSNALKAQVKCAFYCFYISVMHLQNEGIQSVMKF